MILTLLLIVLLVAVVGTLGRDGVWSNTLVFVNVTIAALLATCFFEPLARIMASLLPAAAYLVDIVAIWLLFAVSYLVLRGVTDFLSKTKVRFHKPLDLGGGILMALWTGWVLVCFTVTSLHTAPLGREFLGFSPESRMFFGQAPDRQWLAFVQQVSRGGWGRSGPSSDPEAFVFDPGAEFMLKYATRRSLFETRSGTFVGQE